MGHGRFQTDDEKFTFMGKRKKDKEEEGEELIVEETEAK